MKSIGIATAFLQSCFAVLLLLDKIVITKNSRALKLPQNHVGVSNFTISNINSKTSDFLMFSGIEHQNWSRKG